MSTKKKLIKSPPEMPFPLCDIPTDETVKKWQEQLKMNLALSLWEGKELMNYLYISQQNQMSK